MILHVSVKLDATIFYQIIWVRFFKMSSSREMGTLAQLKNLLNRTTVPNIPKKDVHATEDFLKVVTEGHVISAALLYFGIEDTSDLPDPVLTELLKKMPQRERAAAFEDVAAKIIQPHVDFTIPSLTNATQNTTKDGVRTYAQSLLSLSLLWLEFEDATREGDGPRLMRCWKFLFLLFKDARRKNYAIEAFTLMVLTEAFLSPRQREQLIWSRFINYTGRPGANKAGDLHMEHINRASKAALGNQRSNITPRAVTRVGQAAGPLTNITTQFDRMTALHMPSGKHAAIPHKNDLDKVIDILHNKAKVFMSIEGRKHEHFNTKVSPYTIKKADMEAWMRKRLDKLCF